MSLTVHQQGREGRLLNRRQVLAHVAVAAAFSAMPFNRLYPLTVTPREALLREHVQLLRLIKICSTSGDWSMWEPGSEADKPARWRLARAVVLADELHDDEPHAAEIREAFRQLWLDMTRPQGTIDIMELPEA